MSNPLMDIVIDELLESPVGKMLSHAMDVFAAVQQHVFSLMDDEDSFQLKLLRIGTVFQIFLIDTLATGKNASDLSRDDWKNIASKVSEYAILQDGQGYSEFVFMLYADYIELSVQYLQDRIPKTAIQDMEVSLASITELANTIYTV